MSKKHDEAIKILEDKKRDLKSQIININVAITTIMLEKIEDEYGIEVGSIVVYNRDGLEYQIDEIDTENKWWYSKPWVKGRKKNKDGNYGNRIVNLFDNWEPTTKQ